MTPKKKPQKPPTPPDNTVAKQVAPSPGRWKKGESGNPAGRPAGSRHRTSLALEALMEGESEAITRKAIDLAKDGDHVAMKIVLDRVCPIRKERPVHFEAPDLRKSEDAMTAIASIVRAMADGDLTASEANAAANIVSSFIRAVESAELEARIRRLEEAAAK
jgi:hypothetical protein